MSTPIENRISEIEAKIESSARFEKVLKSLTMLGAVVAFAWALYQHFDSTRSEFRKTFWEKRYAIYSRASQAAAKIAIAPDLNLAQTERAEFWALYWGELSIVESRSVFDAMVKFGENLASLERDPASANNLTALSYTLARACRVSLKSTWEPVPLDDIPLLKGTD